MAVYETGVKTREALIAATGELAAEIGFSSVTLRAVAARAGGNVGSIHYHFGTKEELFAAVVRTAARPWKDNPISDLLKRYDTDTPRGQAGAVRAVVHRNITLLFDRHLPDWHCRIIFQVMQTRGPMRDILQREIIARDHAAMYALFKSINPAIDRKEAFLRTLILNTPVFIHGDHRDFILEFLGDDRYHPGYLQRMEDLLVSQTQLLLQLPTT